MWVVVCGRRGQRGPSAVYDVGLDFSQELALAPRRDVQAMTNSGTLVIPCLVMVSLSVSFYVCLSVSLFQSVCTSGAARQLGLVWRVSPFRSLSSPPLFPPFSPFFFPFPRSLLRFFTFLPLTHPRPSPSLHPFLSLRSRTPYIKPVGLAEIDFSAF